MLVVFGVLSWCVVIVVDLSSIYVDVIMLNIFRKCV